MNRQLIFTLGFILIVLPWPQVAIPQAIKFVIFMITGLILIFQSLKRYPQK